MKASQASSLQEASSQRIAVVRSYIYFFMQLDMSIKHPTYLAEPEEVLAPYPLLTHYRYRYISGDV